MEKKMIAIFLDDERQIDFIRDKLDVTKYDWVVMRNYFDFTDFVDENLRDIKFISFDHDIDSFDEMGAEWTGRDAARYLINLCQEENTPFPDFLVHSMNTIGKQNIIADIKHHISKFENRGNWHKWKYFHTGFVDDKFI